MELPTFGNIIRQLKLTNVRQTQSRNFPITDHKGQRRHRVQTLSMRSIDGQRRIRKGFLCRVRINRPSLCRQGNPQIHAKESSRAAEADERDQTAPISIP